MRLQFRHLDYQVSKPQLSRIFHMRSSAYDDEPSTKGIEIRSLAGYGAPSNFDAENNQYGLTRVMRNGRHMNFYLNDLKKGIGFSPKAFGYYFANMFLNLPAVILRSKTPTALLTKAANLQRPHKQCEQAFVARHSIFSDPDKQVVFTMKTSYVDTEKEEDGDVTLREIFMPVVTDEKVTGLKQINPKDEDANIQTLRALIFFKVFMDSMMDHKRPDVPHLLRAVNELPLNNESTLRDYLTFEVQPRMQPT